MRTRRLRILFWLWAVMTVTVVACSFPAVAVPRSRTGATATGTATVEPLKACRALRPRPYRDIPATSTPPFSRAQENSSPTAVPTTEAPTSREGDR
jgi:hypothetical protein